MVVSGEVQRWWADGTPVTLRADDGSPVELFVRDIGSGPAVTVLHGYPGSSFDWQEVARNLEADHRVVAVDLLGFGASDKPAPHRYSIGEQTGLVLQMWRALGIGDTALVAHDYGATVAQDILTRDDAPRLHPVVLMNGGVFPHLHRPTDGQRLLRGPDGAALAAAVDADLFGASVAATFGPRAPATGRQLQDMWSCLARNDGSRLLADLLHYMDDREEHGERWVTALESTDRPLTFVWGLEDPVSGSHMLVEIGRRLPRATVVPLAGVGHWPMLEDAPGATAAIRDALRRDGFTS